jgi:hypothetical protein
MPDLADLYPGFASHCICVASVLHAMDRSNRSEKTDLTHYFESWRKIA